MTPEPTTGHLPAQMTVIAVRHGSTDLTGQVLNGCGGAAADPELNSLGCQQVAELRELLASWGWLDRVHHTYSSSTRRAMATAEGLTGKAAIIDPRLCEVDFGQWEGQSPQRLWSLERERVSQWHSDPAFAPPGGTSLREAAQRVGQWRAQLHSEVPDGGRAVVLAVAHASTVRILIADALGLSLHHAARVDVGPGAAALLHFWSDGGSSMESLIPTLTKSERMN